LRNKILWIFFLFIFCSCSINHNKIRDIEISLIHTGEDSKFASNLYKLNEDNSSGHYNKISVISVSSVLYNVKCATVSQKSVLGKSEKMKLNM
jgi:hypothetical protein